MRNTLLLAATATALLTSNVCSADNRSGFYLSGGLGVSSSSVEATYGTSSSEESGYSGFLTSVKVGGYINPNFALYYQREAAWFSDDNDNDWLTGLTGIGGTYYFDRSGGVYLEAGLGLGDFMLRNTGEVATGGAAMFGVGGEINDHLQAGIELMSTSTEDPYTAGLEYDIFTMAAKFELKI